jgi:hypothetical protein
MDATIIWDLPEGNVQHLQAPRRNGGSPASPFRGVTVEGPLKLKLNSPPCQPKIPWHEHYQAASALVRTLCSYDNGDFATWRASKGTRPQSKTGKSISYSNSNFCTGVQVSVTQLDQLGYERK